MDAGSLSQVVMHQGVAEWAPVERIRPEHSVAETPELAQEVGAGLPLLGRAVGVPPSRSVAHRAVSRQSTSRASTQLAVILPPYDLDRRFPDPRRVARWRSRGGRTNLLTVSLEDYFHAGA